MPDLTGAEVDYVVEAISSSWISSTGAYVNRFEKEFSKICDTNFCLSVCNGTVALHLALLTLDVRPGDEVIVPSLTYVATANAVRYVGATPVFVDVDPDTWCLDPKLIENAITPRTRGIIAVHLYGHPADMDAINHLAAVHGLWVVEDAAEAPLATYKGRRTGGLARIATFSFYGNKVLTSGEGGAVTIDDPHLALRARTLRGQGVDPHRRYFFPVTGYNFRLTNVACALLCAQLERSEQMLERRRWIFERYTAELADVPGLAFQPVAPNVEICPWLFCIVVTPEFGMSRDALARKLEEQLIETRPFFIPLHTLPPFREAAAVSGTQLPVTNLLASQGLNLPTYTQMSSGDISRVCQSVREARK
jgi:perosamine synthetase